MRNKLRDNPVLTVVIERIRESIFIIFAFLITAFLPQGLHAATIDRILATVNDEFITLSDYRLYLKREGYTQEGVDEAILKRMIEERLILREANVKGITVSDVEIEDMIKEISKERGMSRDEIIEILKGEKRDYKSILRDKILSLKLMMEEVDSKVVVDERELEQFYEKNKEHYRIDPERVEIEMLFMAFPPDTSITELTALKLKSLKVIKMLREGSDFEGIARRYGEFSRPGKFENGALLNPLNDIAFSLKEGEISNPVWTDTGVYIIKVIKKLEAKYQPLNNVKNQIYRILYDNRRAELLNDWLKRLWGGASISLKE